MVSCSRLTDRQTDIPVSAHTGRGTENTSFQTVRLVLTPEQPPAEGRGRTAYPLRKGSTAPPDTVRTARLHLKGVSNHRTLPASHSWRGSFPSTQFVVIPGGTSGKEPACQCGRHKRRRFDPWVRKIPWRRKWQSHSSILAWEIPWTEEPGGLQSLGSKKSQTRLSYQA